MFKVIYKLVVDIKFRVCHEFYEEKKMKEERILGGFQEFHFSSPPNLEELFEGFK